MALYRKSPYRVFCLICLSVLFLLIYSTHSWRSKPESHDRSAMESIDRSHQIRSRSVLPVTINWNEVDEKVFKPHGFAVVKNSTNSFPVVHRSKSQTCEEIFAEWLSINSVKPSWSKPPRDIPESELLRFLMNDYATLTDWYHNDMEIKPVTWDKDEIDKNVQSPAYVTSPDGEGVAVHVAIKKYPIYNQNGLIVGLQNPWLESACIKNKAKKILTVNYQTITSDHPAINFIDAMTLATDWEKYAATFDFVISFSSVQHSGLGRYGDPLDPTGDLREVQKLRCLLKKGGLLFLGIPIGLDMVTFNAHRIYGRIRLPMILEGYELVDIYHGKRSISINELPFNRKSDGAIQFLFVLRRLEDL